MTNSSCHICASPTHFLMKKDGFDEYICSSCELSFVYPQPSPEWLKDTVYSFESGYQSNQKQDLSTSSLDERTGKAIDFLAEERPKGKLLDVGCSNGKLMYWAKQKGFSCSGVELNKRTADMAASHGFPVHQGFLETAPFEKGSFDVVYLGDVIEHVNSPRDFIKTCVSFLKPDGLPAGRQGIIAISTPNVDCFWSKITLWLYTTFGIPWSSATPPHHLFQFSYGNLNMLMNEFKFGPVKSVFTGPHALKYELGMLHLYGAWKKKRTVGSLLFMIFSYAAYTLLFGLHTILKPFLHKRYEMVTIFEQL